MNTVVETTTISQVMDTADEDETTILPGKRPRLEDDAVEFETTKVMVTEEATTTEKVMEVMEAIEEATTTENVMEVTEAIEEATTTEKVMEVIEAIEEATTTEKIMEVETTTLKEMLTTVEVVAISESEDDMTVVTTIRPRLDEEVFPDSTTVQPEQDDQMFLCQPVQTGDQSGDLPMNCEHISGDQEKSVMLLLPREVIGDRINRLFDKNVKIVVRDFMLMDRSPRRL